MLGQLFNLLYGIVDRIFVGQIPGTGKTALASIGVCAPALTAVTTFAYMAGAGGASYMSISLGQKDRRRANEIFGNAFLLLIGIAVMATAALLTLRRPGLYLPGCSDAMYPFAERYFTSYICGTTVSLCGVGLNQFLLAQGFAKQGMLAAVQSFMTVAFCPAQGVTTGCGTIFSYHYGAGNQTKIRQAFLGVFLLCGVYIGLLQIAAQLFPQLFTGLFLRDGALSQQASACIRMYTLALLGVAVQYALVDGLTAMGKVKYTFPPPVFRKIVYIVCIFALPRLLDIQFVFYAGSISDAIGAAFSLVLFLSFSYPKLKIHFERGMNHE